MNIFVFGSLAFDKIMDFPGKFSDNILPDKIHTLNVSFTISNLQENFGGTAGNIAYNLALLGEQPTILATAGSDFEAYREWLAGRNINTDGIKIIAGEKTAFANIITDQADNQLAAFYPGAMNYSCALEPEAKEGEAWAIVAPGFPADMARLAKFYRERNLPFIFDPGQQIPVLSADDLRFGIKGAKMLISNDYELSLLMKKTGWSEEKILENAEALVTTLGEKGSQIKTKDAGYSIPPAKPKNTIDPTGAGDAYRAGFIKGLVSGWPLEIAGRFAGVVAVYTVEQYGTQTHQFNFAEAAERYRENFKEELPI
ncbi:carbohydrate kinase family protein [Candidatus Falkowbacteria bacterium CG10_big_fil_rev_8_21_14_0_10_44_15]|uniref:Carbohydrate kinase family protein n=1 Tax=Candidatus Falkowbacteria bacterium CG10_big_fil_rev_8_21_14_0_10_44_15 TaxID=1974569 RepID=A0A2H0V0F6_9BACT|nr:MAG: carbohydrate kinase family protein [Candidatus Falkowbacteria bacterium CG10_big_fil_rev_8_21_14_0_10_44_15]